MTEIRPVQLETPQKRQAFIDSKTGALSDYGHHVMSALFERTGGFDDDVWKSLGIGFTNLSQQANSVRRLEELETATAGVNAALNGLRGDPRLATAERAEGLAEDALFTAMSRAPADVVRRVEELERATAVIATAINQVRADQRTISANIQDQEKSFAMQGTFHTQVIASRVGGVQGEVDDIDRLFEDRSRAALTGTSPVAYSSGSGEIALNVSLTSLGGLTTAANKAYYTSATDVWADYDLSAFGRTFSGLADASAARSNLGVVIGSDVQAYSANLAAYAAVAPTAAGLALLDDATAADQRDTLGLSTQTGWSAATGTATRATFDTTTVTLPQLAERVKALIDDGLTLDLIGA